MVLVMGVSSPVMVMGPDVGTGEAGVGKEGGRVRWWWESGIWGGIDGWRVFFLGKGSGVGGGGGTGIGSYGGLARAGVW